MITLLPFITLVAVTGVVFYQNTIVLMAAFAGFFALYAFSHRALMRSRFTHDTGVTHRA